MRPGSNKPRIILLGVNHKTAPVEIRERLALKDIEPSPLELFSNLSCCEEAVFLSTCNRVEILASSKNHEDAADTIKRLWLEKGGLSTVDLSKSIYSYKDRQAIRHVFRVASSLDSMVVGEPQILGQLKEAYRMASKAGSSGLILNRLMHKAFSVAKRVRTETRIASQAVSISYAAVELAKKIFGDLSGKKVLLIGAGEMAELAAQHLLTNGVDKIIVANRTLERAVELARSLNGAAISLDEIEDAMIEADIVISSTGAPGIIVKKEQIKKILRPRRHRLLFLIDIAVPRDIDPAINDIDNVYLYDIDELKDVVEENKAEREKEAQKAERMVEAEVIKFISWMDTLDVVPIIQKLQEKAERVRLQEMARSQKRLGELTQRQRDALEILTKSITNKILHDPVVCLRKGLPENERDQVLAITCKLFGIDDGNNNK